MKDDKAFQIKLNPGETTAEAVTLDVNHNDETYAFEWGGKAIAIINNGDNSWSLVSGELDQLTINLIGDAIEKYYLAQGW